ncbi:zinc metalloprotease [Lentinula edodes]|uniref:Zinc metalloprotease n=1 Tax=Lentinula edodes TaxID=5353 RepID=A0A1Q3ECS9_LENED|nr:zinc metalloprotease [Lentinula edodes]
MSFVLKLYALAVVFLLSVVDLTSASSKRAGRLKRLAHPSTLSLEILPRHQHYSSPIPLSSYDKRQLLTPHSHTLHYSDSFRLIIFAFDEAFHLHLRPNDHLVHPAARITYHTVDSEGRSSVTHTEPLLRESVRAYWGEVIDGDESNARLREDAAGVLPRPSRSPSELGWARIMVHHEGNLEEGVAPVYEGAFSYKGVVHHIMTKDNYVRNKHHLDPEILVDTVDSNLVVWRDSDLIRFSPAMCGHDDLLFNTDPALNPVLRKPFTEQSISLGPFGNISLSRRDDVAGSGSSYNFEGTIGNTAGCPTTQKLLYMGVAADCKYVSNYGGSMNATTQILMNWNSASALYKSTFNVSLGIVEVQVQNETCPTTADPTIPWNVDCSNVDLNNRLSLFSDWRGQRGNDSIGLWHLMSGCPTGTEVGIAWLGTLCQTDASGTTGSISSGTGVSTNGLTEWQVVAHEIGHNFGAIHDCTDGCNSTTVCCPLSSSTCNAGSQFIMNPVSASSEKTFSLCSLGNICSLMSGTSSGGKTDASCLVDASSNTRSLLSLQMCGNGIVEDGEDCDPGNGVTSSCSRVVHLSVVFLLLPKSVGLQRMLLVIQRSFVLGLHQLVLQMSSRLMDPNNSNSCIQLASLLVDGSPCGYGGTCSSGACRPGSILDIVKAWYSANLQIAIPVTVVGGIVILLLLYVSITACRRCYIRRKFRNAPASKTSEPSMRHQRLSSNNSASTALRVPSVRRPPPIDRENAWRPINRASGNRSTWVDPTQYNGHLDR